MKWHRLIQMPRKIDRYNTYFVIYFKIEKMVAVVRSRNSLSMAV